MNDRKGFTLVELMVVIAILAILVILVLPNFIDSYNKTEEKAMIVQENEVVDAAKMALENYCVHPIDNDYSKCGIVAQSTSSTRGYVCLNRIQNKITSSDTPYIDTIISGGKACTGFIYYEKEENNKSYINLKAYLTCGDGYQTPGIEQAIALVGEDVKEKCLLNTNISPDTPTPDTPTPDTPPNIPNGSLMASNEGLSNTNYLRTTIFRL